jgi:arginase
MMHQETMDNEIQNKLKSLALIGASLGISGKDPSCRNAPDILKQSPLLQVLQTKHIKGSWQAMLYEKPKTEVIQNVSHLCTELAKLTHALAGNKRFCVFGGDHATAIGTWSGAQHALEPQGDLGLIWFDAHMDAHTHDTSHTGNIHGMPVAALLGHGIPALTQILNPHAKLKPEHLCLIGIRSFESDEKKLLDKLGVRVFMIEDVQSLGLANIIQEAKRIVSTNTQGYGISIDLDAFDPTDAPAVATPEPGGITARELLPLLSFIGNDPHCIGYEITEFNPDKDVNEKTQQLIFNILTQLCGG